MGSPSDLRKRRLRFGLKKRQHEKRSGMSMMEHLGELRSRIIKSLAAFLLISIAVFFFYDPILEFFRRPLCDVDPSKLGPQGCDLVYNKLIGGFNFRLKMTALVGIALTSPVWLYQIWAFVAPALNTKEKRYSVPFMAASTLLFLMGSGVAYMVLPAGINFLIDIGGSDLVPLLGAEEYLNFVGLMLLGFGVMFELPLVLFFLGLIGAVSIEQLRAGRRTAIVLITILAAVITPSQDPYTMLLLAVPLYLFFEITILLLSFVLKRRAKAAL